MKINCSECLGARFLPWGSGEVGVEVGLSVGEKEFLLLCGPDVATGPLLTPVPPTPGWFPWVEEVLPLVGSGSEQGGGLLALKQRPCVLVTRACWATERGPKGI